MFSFGASSFDPGTVQIPASQWYSPSSGVSAPVVKAEPVTGPAELVAGGGAKVSDRPPGFPAANETVSGLPSGATVGGVSPDAQGNVPASGGQASNGGINYGQLIGSGLKGIGHGIGKYAMAGAENRAIPQAPSGYQPVLSPVTFVPPGSYQRPVLMG